MTEDSVPDAKPIIKDYKIPVWHAKWFWACVAFQLVFLCFVIKLLCFSQKICLIETPICTETIIPALAIFILGILIIELWLLSDRFVHNKRLVDEHQVKTIIGDTTLAIKRQIEKSDGTILEFPEDYSELKASLDNEAERLRGLKREELVEFQLVSIQQIWTEFLDPKELIAEARSTLEDLQDFADNPKVPYDTKQYWRWDTRISRAIENIEIKEKSKNDGYDATNLEEASEDLKHNLKVLYYHIADYSLTWARGAVLIRLLLTAGFGSAVVFAFLGLLPLLQEHPHFTIFNWSMLAASGAVTGVLKSLHKADTMEVGDNDGNHEIWRAIATVPLGLIAGIATYALIATGAINGSMVPPLESDYVADTEIKMIHYIGTHILWPLAAGFLFEATYSRL